METQNLLLNEIKFQFIATMNSSTIAEHRKQQLSPSNETLAFNTSGELDNAHSNSNSNDDEIFNCCPRISSNQQFELNANLETANRKLESIAALSANANANAISPPSNLLLDDANKHSSTPAKLQRQQQLISPTNSNSIISTLPPESNSTVSTQTTTLENTAPNQYSAGPLTNDRHSGAPRGSLTPSQRSQKKSRIVIRKFQKLDLSELHSTPAPDVKIGQRVAYKEYYGNEFGTIRWIGKFSLVG